MPTTFKEFISELITSPDFKIREPHVVRYILDKSFIISLIEGKEINDKFTKALTDLFISILERTKIYILIPVDALIELEKEGKNWVTNKSFLKFINSLASIKEVNPAIEINAVNSVIKLAEKYNQNSTPCLILTLDKEKYKDLESSSNKINIATPREILFTLCFMYDCLPNELRDLYNAWFKSRDIEY